MEDKHINEEGEGGAPDGFATTDSVNGMGAPQYANRGVDGSGDISQPANTKKRRKKIKNFSNFISTQR